jgi:hypothetical protein
MFDAFWPCDLLSLLLCLSSSCGCSSSDELYIYIYIRVKYDVDNDVTLFNHRISDETKINLFFSKKKKKKHISKLNQDQINNQQNARFYVVEGGKKRSHMLVSS